MKQIVEIKRLRANLNDFDILANCIIDKTNMS